MKKIIVVFSLVVMMALSFTVAPPAHAMTDAEFLAYLKVEIAESRIPEAVGNAYVSEIEAKIAAEEAEESIEDILNY